MKKPGHHETRVNRGFVGSIVRSRLADFLNIRLLLMDAIRRFAARRQSPRVVEGRTYVFILVPFDFRANGHVRKTELEQDLIDNSRHADDPRTNGPFSTLAALNRAASRTTVERDLNNAPGLNHDLMDVVCAESALAAEQELHGSCKSFPLRAEWLQCKDKERKLNTKKCLITTVSVLLMTAVMHAQEASDLTAEKQLAQRKAELDAREKALNEREKTLARRERATANSTRRSQEKAGAKAKQQEAKAQSEEEQAKAAASEKKLHEPFWKRLDEAFLEQLGTPAYIPGTPPPVTAHSAPAIRFTAISQRRLANRRHSRHSDHR